MKVFSLISITTLTSILTILSIMTVSKAKESVDNIEITEISETNNLDSTTTAKIVDVDLNSEFSLPGVSHLEDIKDLQSKIKDHETTYFLYYYHPDSENSKKGIDFLKELKTKLEYLVEMLLVNCQTSEYKDKPVCKKPEQVKDGFPRMVMLSPPKVKINPYTNKENSYTEKKFQEKEVSQRTLYKFITENIPDYSIELNNENIDAFLKEADYNKLILFTDKDHTPLLYRGLSGYFYDRLKFGIVHTNQKDIINRFIIKSSPTLLMYNTMDEGVYLFKPVIDIYNGETTAASIIDAISYTALPEKKYITERKKKEKESVINNNKELNKDSNEKKIGIKQMTPAIIEYYINRSLNRPIFLLFKSKNSDSHDAEYEDFLQISKSSSSFAVFLEFNCLKQEIVEFVETKLKHKCPELDTNSYYFFKLAKDQPNFPIEDFMGLTTNLEGFDYKKVERMLKEIYPSSINEISSSEYEETKKEILKQKKIVFIHLYDLYEESKSVLPIHLISSVKKYTDKIGFIGIEYPDLSILQSLKVNELPKLLALMPHPNDETQLSVVAFNEEVVFHRLQLFIDTFLVQGSMQKDYIVEDRRDVNFIPNNKSLKSRCGKDSKLCVLGFLDGRQNKRSFKDFNKHINILEDVSNNKLFNQLEFSWVNATCQVDFANHFNAEVANLPRIVAYIPKTNQYTIMYRAFERDNISQFVDNVIKGKAVLLDFDNEKMHLRNSIKCDEIKEEEVFEYDDDDEEIIREIVEESSKKENEYENYYNKKDL